MSDVARQVEQDWLEKAVELGEITQEEADEIYTKKYPEFHLN